MKRAVIYARVSSKRQADDGVSMESQIEQCRIKARSLDAEVVEVVGNILRLHQQEERAERHSRWPTC